MSARAEAAERLEERFGPAAVSVARARADAPELPLVSPASVEEWTELARFAAQDELVLLPIGLGSKLGWCRPPTRADLLVSTRRFAGIVSHVPDDGTLSARAGTRMDELRAATRAGGHFLTPDVARPSRATLGGVLAAGESGADRLRFGAARDHVLGMRVLLADASIAKCGGQLVKNVTGYDLHRLYCGSHGTLCVILEAALRLFPEPEHELLLEIEARDTARMLELARAALAQDARIVTLSAERGTRDGAWNLRARLFGKRETVGAERAALVRAWNAASVIEDDVARRAAESARDGGFERDDVPWLHVTSLRSKLPLVLDALESSLAEDGAARRWSVHPGIASVDVQLAPSEIDLARRARDMRTLLARIPSARTALRNAPAAALAAFDPFEDAPRGLELMRALKSKLDPDGRFAAGRFHGGL